MARRKGHPKRPGPLARTGPERQTMRFTVRHSSGKTSIRVQIGSLAITVEFPL
jgi:hypothetical protein